MDFQTIIGPPSGTGSGIFPTPSCLSRAMNSASSTSTTAPFGVGRKVDKDLVIADPRVSRDHAQIVSENGVFSVVDQGSKAWDLRQR